MELKSYQKEVIADLARYLELVVELQSPAKAYQALWNEKNVLVGFGGMPNYVNVLPGVPHVCAKVPTGGGKTLIAPIAVSSFAQKMAEKSAPRLSSSHAPLYPPSRVWDVSTTSSLPGFISWLCENSM